jgi:hypothetical protein
VPVPEPKPEPIACTADFRPGIEVSVTTPNPNACSATVEIQDGTYTETLKSQGSSGRTCVFSGAGERAGKYTITASLKGFTTQTLSTKVAKDECHVITQKLSVKLVPQP